MSKTDGQLQAEISANESRSEWSIAAVLVGLLIEVGFAAAKSLEVEINSAVENWGAVAADSLVFLGVFCELLFGRRASHGNSELRSRADERLATANARAAQAELRTEQLKSALAWRRLTPENIEKMAGVLAQHGKFCLRIMFVGDDAESNAFAHDIGRTFSSDGWRVLFMACSFHSEIPFGMRIPLWELPDLEAVAIVRTAISNAGLEYTGYDLPPPISVITSGQDITGPVADIYLGPKPMPDLK
jgi:hypothetical protein